MRYQIMVNKGTNLWAFYDEQGFMYAAETEAEMAEKVRELAKSTPLDSLKVVAVLDTEAVIKVESLCPEPEEPTPPDNPGTEDPDKPGTENPDTPPVTDPENPGGGGSETPDTGGEGEGGDTTEP